MMPGPINIRCVFEVSTGDDDDDHHHHHRHHDRDHDHDSGNVDNVDKESCCSLMSQYSVASEHMPLTSI